MCRNLDFSKAKDFSFTPTTGAAQPSASSSGMGQTNFNMQANEFKMNNTQMNAGAIPFTPNQAMPMQM